MARSESKIESEEWRGRTAVLAPPFFTLGAFVLLAGHFLPWAAHPAAALTRSGHDLSISTNFTPGAGVFANEWFLLPLWAAAILLALVAASAPPLRRAALGGGAFVVASLGLPTYPQVLVAYASPDHRAQLFITLAIFVGVAGLLCLGRRAQSIHPYLLAACAVASIVPLVGYLVVRPFIEALYRSPVGVGAGWWVTVGGVVLLFVLSGVEFRASLRRSVSVNL